MGAISQALKLSRPQSSIIGSNIQFRDKIHILRSAIHVSSLSDEEKLSYKKKIQEITDYYPTRNMIAHDVFTISWDEKGVSFLYEKAKGSVRFVEAEWGVKDFREAFDKLETFQDVIFEVGEKISGADLLEALIESQHLESKREHGEQDH